MTTKPTPPAGSPPPNCPACGRRTADNFTRPDRAGLHCHDDSSEAWATYCGIILCTCGVGYSARDCSKGPMHKLDRR